MAKPDYSTWITKQAAADAIGVSTKTIEKFASEGRLQQADWKRPQGGPAIVVYHPAEVDKIARDRNTAEPFVTAPDEKPAANGTALAVRQPNAEQFMQALAAALRDASQNSQKHAEVRLAERLYLTIGEAAEYTGLGVGYLRRRIAEGKLKPVKGAGPHGADVLRRAALEKL